MYILKVFLSNQVHRLYPVSDYISCMSQIQQNWQKMCTISLVQMFTIL